jgi:hypothetical protein
VQWQALTEHFGYYADFVSQHRRVATIRGGVEDRGLTRGNIREQRGRGNVVEATINCGTCSVVDNWLGVIKSW